MRITKKITSIVLAVMMVVSMMSVMAFSANAVGETVPENKYLTFTAEEANSSVTLKFSYGSNFQYNKNNSGWQDYTKGTQITLENVGDYVRFSGEETEFNNYNHVSLTGKVACSGSVMSLRLNGGKSQGLINYCFQYMFYGCTSLTQAPELPETTLAKYCYAAMFGGCTSLTKAPVLPATNLAASCYRYMFIDCKNLTELPALPATTLADYCYAYMFNGCPKICISDQAGTFDGITYSAEYRIPSTGTGTPAEDPLDDMFLGTGGKFTGTPSLNTKYYLPAPAPPHTEHTYVNNPTFNWSQDANGDWSCNKLTLTCSGCDATQDYEATGFFGTSAVTVTANDDGSFTYSVSKKVDGVTYTDTKTNAANGVIKSTNQLKAAAKKGGSWELDADLTGVTDVQCANGFVLDGNNHTVTRHASVSTQAVFRTTTNPAEVTLKNLTIDGIEGQADLKPAIATKQSNPSAGNVINLENVTITNYDFDASNNGVVLAWGQATVNMKDCNVDTDSDYDVWGGAASTINVDGGKVGTAYLNGGTSSANLTNGADVDSFAVPEGKKIKDNGNGTYTVVEKVYVAQVGDNKYESLAEAITAAQDGGTVKLLADQTIDLQLAAGEEYTIDLNSYTLTVESPQKSYNYIYGNLTIDDSSAAKTGQVVVDDYGIAPRAGGKVTVNSGSFTTAAGKDYIFYLMGGELEVNGGSFTANHPVNCYSSGKKAYGGKVVINDGDFESTKYFVISGFENSDITINGGEFEGPYPIYVDKTSSLSSGFTPASATINGGTFTATSNGGYGNTIVDCENGASVTIKGGTFTGGDLYADDSSDISVSGGTFDSAVPEEFCAEGFIPKDNGDDTYGVKIGTYVAQIGSTKYETLGAAVAAAQDGDTIKVLRNFTTAQTDIPAGKELTLDLGGYTVSGVSPIRVFGTLTIENGTISATDRAIQSVGTTTIEADAKIIAGNVGYLGFPGSVVYMDGEIEMTSAKDALVVQASGAKAYVSGRITTAGTAVNALGPCEVELKDGAYISGCTYGVYASLADPVGPTVVVRDGVTINATSYAITGNGSEGRGKTTITIEGGELHGDDAAIFHPQEGTLTITGGTLEGGKNGIYMKSGTANISGGTIKGLGEKVDYEFKDSGWYPTGDAFTVDNSDYPGGVPSVTITGGTFISENADAVASYAKPGLTAIDHFVSGGYFSNRVDGSLCVEDCFSVGSALKPGMYIVDSLKNFEINADNAKDVDSNAFDLSGKYNKGTILGVQRKDKASVDARITSDSKQETGNDLRFVAVLDTEILNAADDYGFVLAKVTDGTKTYNTTNTVFDNLKKGDDRAKTISAKGTYNNVCGDELYGDPTDTTTAYKYITCAVNGLSDTDKVATRFYVTIDGKTYYAQYAGYNYAYTGCTAGMSLLG